MDKLPRVPDAHGDVVDEKIFSDLYIRTSWVDANVALDQINKASLFRFFLIEFFDTTLTTFERSSNVYNFSEFVCSSERFLKALTIPDTIEIVHGDPVAGIGQKLDQNPSDIQRIITIYLRLAMYNAKNKSYLL